MGWAWDYSYCSASELTDGHDNGFVFSRFLENTEQTKISSETFLRLTLKTAELGLASFCKAGAAGEDDQTRSYEYARLDHMNMLWRVPLAAGDLSGGMGPAVVVYRQKTFQKLVPSKWGMVLHMFVASMYSPLF